MTISARGVRLADAELVGAISAKPPLTGGRCTRMIRITMKA
ncbi:MAG: hypothetical protein K0S42_1488, partial [Microvirga sp.]|nr:hypothetical protein [Microvirga sp.]